MKNLIEVSLLFSILLFSARVFSSEMTKTGKHQRLSQVQNQESPSDSTSHLLPPPSALNSSSDSTTPVPPELMDGQLLQNLELIPKLRDPFLIPTLRNTSPSQKNELENNPIGSFKLLGVLIGINEPRALIQGPSGETYLLTENRKIGSQGGFVKKINPDSIVIREKETNLMGIEEIIDTPIPLGKDGKEINLNPNH